MKFDDAQFGAAYQKARERWAGVALSEDAYRAFVEARCGGADLQAVDCEGLYLACACASGDAAALRLFEETYFDEIDRVIRKHRREDLRDELRQRLRVKLFVAPDGANAAIASYSGRGSLRRWLRMAATRALINLMTRGVAETPVTGDFLADMIGGEGDPELEYIKHGYRIEFQQAFKACLAELDEHDQTLLRSAFRDGLTVDALAAIHAVHRSTVARWVVKAHRRLVACIRARLMAELGMNRSELDSMFNLIFSRMELTLEERVE